LLGSYEFGNTSITADPTPKLCTFAASGATAAAEKAASAAVESMKELLRSRLRSATTALLRADREQMRVALEQEQMVVSAEEAAGEAAQEAAEEAAEEAVEEMVTATAVAEAAAALFPMCERVPPVLERALEAAENDRAWAEAAMKHGEMGPAGAPEEMALEQSKALAMAADEEEEEEDAQTICALELQDLRQSLSPPPPFSHLLPPSSHRRLPRPSYLPSVTPRVTSVTGVTGGTSSTSSTVTGHPPTVIYRLTAGLA
jgi:hypothetical protein